MTEPIHLVRPARRYLTSYLAGCRESYGSLHNLYIMHDPNRFEEWRGTIFDDFARREQGLGLPPGYVPSSVFWLVRGKRYLGSGDLRHRLTPELEHYGGQLGVAIRRSERGRGYGKLLLQLLLQEAFRRGQNPVLVTCRAENTASRRCAEALAPAAIEVNDGVADGVPGRIYRYWFRSDFSEKKSCIAPIR